MLLFVVVFSHDHCGRCLEWFVVPQWLKQDLVSVDRTTTPFVIVMTHVPMYHTNTAHEHQRHTFASSYGTLFTQHQVDFVLSGHVHAYER